MLDKCVLYFLAVVEEGSFSAAGKAYGITQSAISQQIAFLENDLEVTLFDRTFYKPKLTKAGKIFYDFSTAILQKEAMIQSEIKEISRIEECVLHIGITGPLESVHLPKIIALYEEQYPEKIIKVTKSTFVSCSRQLLEGELDATFGMLQGFTSQPMLEVLPLMEQKIGIICSPNHPLGKNETVTLEELRAHPIIALSKKACPDYYVAFNRNRREEKIILNTARSVDSMDDLLRAVQLDQGIAWIGEETARHSDNVQFCPLAENYYSDVLAIAKRKRNQNKDIQNFMAICKAYFDRV